MPCLRYYRSSDAHISTRDTEVGSDSVCPLVQSGYQRRRLRNRIRLTAPTQPGVYYYGACVELRNEENTGNNCSGAVSITVRRTGISESSDLVVDLPTLNHRTLGPGEPFMLETTVRNQGNGTASLTTLRGYQSDNASISSNAYGNRECPGEFAHCGCNRNPTVQISLHLLLQVLLLLRCSGRQCRKRGEHCK